MRVLTIALLLALTTGCRLSDPFYGFKRLEAPEPPGPEYSLVYVSVRGGGGFLAGGDVFALAFTRVDPHGRNTPAVGASTEAWFRAFRPRPVKDGHFLMVIPPGVYELEGMMQKFLWSYRTWRVTGEAKAASRIHITRPGIYDLGTLNIREATWGSPAALEAEGDAFSDERLRVLRAAVVGTRWQKILDEAPKRRRKKVPPPDQGTIAWVVNEDSPR